MEAAKALASFAENRFFFFFLVLSFLVDEVSLEAAPAVVALDSFVIDFVFAVVVAAAVLVAAAVPAATAAAVAVAADVGCNSLFKLCLSDFFSNADSC